MEIYLIILIIIFILLLILLIIYIFYENSKDNNTIYCNTFCGLSDYNDIYENTYRDTKDGYRPCTKSCYLNNCSNCKN